MEIIVVLAVVEVLFETPADHEAMVVIDRNVAQVEQLVNVCAEQEPVGSFVKPTLDVGSDRAASRIGSVFSPVTAHRRSYASVTTTRNAPWPRRGFTRIGVPKRSAAGTSRSGAARLPRSRTASHSPAPSGSSVL
jgi:hypothetical protein